MIKWFKSVKRRTQLFHTLKPKIYFFVQIFFSTIGEKPAPGDPESDDEISSLP